MTPYRIIIADDHAMLRQALRRILEDSPQIAVVGEAGDGLELLKLLQNIQADLVVLDISMPNMRGIEAINEIKKWDPRIKTLMLTMHKRKEYLYEALTAGADGYLLKEDTNCELMVAIEKIRAGGTYVSPTLSNYLADYLVAICRQRDLPAGDPLSPRERQVLKLLAEGKSNKATAELLFISVKTVEHHRASIMKKLSLHNIAELVRYALSSGYVTNDF
jgi:DNA-binding NarL/FixJ family response regulator